jgi:hypothetical protein
LRAPRKAYIFFSMVALDIRASFVSYLANVLLASLLLRLAR